MWPVRHFSSCHKATESRSVHVRHGEQAITATREYCIPRHNAHGHHSYLDSPKTSKATRPRPMLKSTSQSRPLVCSTEMSVHFRSSLLKHCLEWPSHSRSIRCRSASLKAKGVPGPSSFLNLAPILFHSFPAADSSSANRSLRVIALPRPKYGKGEKGIKLKFCLLEFTSQELVFQSSWQFSKH